jgi:hypothetical protein
LILQSLEAHSDLFLHFDGEVIGVLYEALKSFSSNLPLVESISTSTKNSSSIPMRLSNYISKMPFRSEGITSTASDSSANGRRKNGAYPINDQVGIYGSSLNRIKAVIEFPIVEERFHHKNDIPRVVDNPEIQSSVLDILNRVDLSEGIQMSRMIPLIAKKLSNVVSPEDIKRVVRRLCQCRTHKESDCSKSSIDCVFIKRQSDEPVLADPTFPWISIDGSINQQLQCHFESSVLSFLMNFPHATLERIHNRLPLLTISQVERLLVEMQSKRLLRKCVCSNISLASPFSGSCDDRLNDFATYHLI